MLRPYRTSFLFASAWVALATLHAQDTLPQRMLKGDLHQMLGTPDTSAQHGLVTEIADMVSQQVQEAPGIIYVLTAEEIAASGSRDLDEALALIPGFIAGRDEDDLMGMYVRGHWALEGKCLYMLNGMPLNEASFGTFSLGLRLPLDNVARIEVINGPGSVHGSFATLAVVNIITKDIRNGEGMEAMYTQTHLTTGGERRYTGLSGRHRLSEVTELNYAAQLCTGPRFTGTVQMEDGPINYSDSTGSETFNAFFSIRRKSSRVQVWGSEHSLEAADRSYTVRMRTLMVNGEQNLILSKKTRLNLNLLYRHQLPWLHENDSNWTTYPFNTIDRRGMVSAMLLTHPASGLQLRLGTQGTMDHSRFSNRTPGAEFELTGRPDITVLEGALYGELVVRGRWGSLIGGARAVTSNINQGFVAPRLAYTKLFGPWNVKLLATNAYRPPTIQNLTRHEDEHTLNAEEVWTYEAEAGYHLGTNTSISLCAFHTQVDNLIIALHEGHGIVYDDRGTAATRGLELSLHHRMRNAGVYLAASTYQVDQRISACEDSELPAGNAQAYHGSPQHKVAAVFHWEPWTRWRLDLRGVYTGEAFSYLSNRRDHEAEEEEFGELELDELDFVRFPAVIRLDAGLSFSLKRVERLRMRFSCENILDHTSWAMSPHNDGDAALPNSGRQWTIKLEYRFAL